MPTMMRKTASPSTPTRIEASAFLGMPASGRHDHCDAGPVAPGHARRVRSGLLQFQQFAHQACFTALQPHPQAGAVVDAQRPAQ